VFIFDVLWQLPGQEVSNAVGSTLAVSAHAPAAEVSLLQRIIVVIAHNE